MIHDSDDDDHNDDYFVDCDYDMLLKFWKTSK